MSNVGENINNNMRGRDDLKISSVRSSIETRGSKKTEDEKNQRT